jgi:hypothetical protein
VREAALSQAGELRAQRPSQLGTKRGGTTKQALEAANIRPHVASELDPLEQELGAAWQAVEARVVGTSWRLFISARTGGSAPV